MPRILAALFVLFVATVASAQRSPMATSTRLMLVMMPDVRKEIKLTKAQDKQIQDSLKKMESDAKEGRLPTMMSLLDGPDMSMDGILDAPQIARLDELFVQANKGFSLSDAKVSAALDLSGDQKSTVAATKSEFMREMMQALPSLRSTGAVKALEKKREAASEKILGLLSADQKAKFELLKGKPFKFRD